MPADGWADAAAAQVMVIAFGDPNAREQIANLLQYIHLEGRSEALREAAIIFAPVNNGEPREHGSTEVLSPPSGADTARVAGTGG